MVACVWWYTFLDAIAAHHSIKMSLIALFLLLAGCQHTLANDVASPLPVVIWHGMGDSCCSNHSIGAIGNLIRQELGK